MNSEEKSDAPTLFLIYLRHKILNVREFLSRIFFAFFRPMKLAEQIKLEDFDSFKHAIDDLLIAFSIFAISDPALSFLIGAELNQSRVAKTFEEMRAIFITLILPTAVFFVVRSMTSRARSEFHSYVQCCAYFVTAVTIASAIFTASTLLITKHFYGYAKMWQAINFGESCGRADDFECSISTAINTGGVAIKSWIFQREFTFQNDIYVINMTLSVVLIILSFWCHLIVLKEILKIKITHAFLFYILYFAVVCIYLLKPWPWLAGVF